MLLLLKKVLLIAVFILIYFLGIREIRVMIHDFHLGTILPAEYGQLEGDLYFISKSPVSFTFYEEAKVIHKKWKYKIPFGLFFLLGFIGLILIDVDKILYLYLIGIHAMGVVISFLFLNFATRWCSHFLIVPDLLTRYLIPLFSLGLAALTYIQQKEKAEE